MNYMIKETVDLLQSIITGNPQIFNLPISNEVMEIVVREMGADKIQEGVEKMDKKLISEVYKKGIGWEAGIQCLKLSQDNPRFQVGVNKDGNIVVWEVKK